LKEKVAVATVDGKTYFLIVNELREQNIPFVSVIPGEPLPSEVKVVITTEREKPKVKHERTLVFSSENSLVDLFNEIKRILLGKEAFEKIIVGIDPGEAIGLAVIADGKVIEEGNCFSTPELISSILKRIRNINFTKTSICVKIGNGVPIYQDLLQALDDALPSEVVLEVVNEAGINRPLHRRSRKIRHISSAKRIAARTGNIILRRKEIATNC
jgi:hypothetical protein